MSAYTTFSAPLRARLLTGCALAAAAVASQAHAQRAFQAVPTNSIGAEINQDTGIDIVNVLAPQALIDWTPVDNAGTGTINILAAGDELRFQVDDATALPRYTILNRINPADQSRAVRIDGIVNSLVDTGYGISDGSIWFYTPGGIILGNNARFDVGSLVLTSNAIQVGNFDTEGLFVGQGTNATSGTIAFRGAADSKSFVTVEAGAKINAAGSYVALVAPRVAQRGAITVNGSAAMIAAESADVTIPVSGNLFEIAVFSGSKADTTGETILAHTGSTEIADPAQVSDSRRIYMVAVPKNDAITMLVSGTAGYQAASQVTASAGRVILVAETNPTITATNILTQPGFSGTTKIAGFTSNTNVFAQGVFVDIDATTASSTFGRELFVNFGSEATVKIANGFQVDVGADSNGSAGFGVGQTSISVDSGGKFTVANNLTVSSNLGSFGSGPFTGTSLFLTVDNGTIDVGGNLTMQSIAGGGPGGQATGGDVTAVVRNSGLVNVGGNLFLSSQGNGGFGSASGGDGIGGASSLKVASGGTVTAGSLNIGSRGQGGGGTTAGAGKGGTASLTVDNGLVSANTTLSVVAEGLGGDSSATNGKAGAGRGGTVDLAVTGTGQANASTLLQLLAFGGGGFETGYGATGGTGTGGAINLTATGGGVAAPAVTLDASGQGRSGQRGGGAGAGGDITLTLTGGSKLDTGNLGIFLNGTGGNDTGSAGAAGGNAVGGDAVVNVSGATLGFDQLTLTALGLAGFSSVAQGGNGQGGTATIALTGATAPRANRVTIDASGQGAFGAAGGDGTGGKVGFTVATTSFVSTGDFTVDAQGEGESGNLGGGFGKGGTIDLAATGGTITAANLNADASGIGERSFDSGAGGLGQGGTITLTSNPGGLIKGPAFVVADGRGGDADNISVAGEALGGTIIVRATGGAIDVASDTSRFFANGLGGRGSNPAIARGGTIDIGVSGTGQLLVDTMIAQASGTYNDQSDGLFLNHGGTGVGGTVRLAVTGGSVTGDQLSLEAFGTGAVSASGGVGGAAFQGRAELGVSGGVITLNTLSVTAVAVGGPGIGQDDEIGDEAGSGGTAGVGASPFAGEAGAIVTVTGGALAVGNVAVSGNSEGGAGGGGAEFAETPLAGRGGDAVGGVAVFAISGAGSVEIGSLAVNSLGLGGNGGNVFLFDSSVSDAVAGRGGSGTGGLVSITFGGTGTLAPNNVFGDATGRGGLGGAVRPFFGESSIGGDGRGGDGGGAVGGGVNLTVNDALADFAFLSARADATGGAGGVGPRGGNGGGAIAGSGTIAVATGDTFYGGFQLFAEGTGGSGADGLGGDAGSGGAGTGGNATITIGATADLVTDFLQLSSRGFGGDGGRGADNTSGGFAGGNGGTGAGGTAKITVSGGALTLFGGSETAPVGLFVRGSAGGGGSGGNGVEGTAGSGGNGGDAFGGSGFVTSTGGALDLFALEIDANALAGERGQPGSGQDGIFGIAGFGEAGSVLISADQTGAPGNRLLLGDTVITADASTRSEEIGLGRAGDVRISAQGADPAGAIQFASLEVTALGTSASSKAAHGIEFSGAGTPVTATGSVDLEAVGSIAFGFDGDAGLRTAGDLDIRSDGSILVSHAGQAPGGVFASLAGRDVTLDTAGDISALAATRIDATGDLTLTAAGLTQIGSARVGRSLAISAGGDAIVSAGAQVVADRSVTILSGDDIIVDTGALLRAANNPPPESGYGAGDPLQQETQLKLYAGALFLGEGDPADVRSLLIRGDVQSPGRTMQLEAEAIQAADGTTLSGANLYLRKLGTTPAIPSDDFGQLTAPCLQGSVCLASGLFDGVVQIGGSGFAPTNLRITGDLSGATVFAGATNTVQLGRDGSASSISATDSLTIDARDGDLLGLGAITLTGGTGTTSLFAGGNLSAAGLRVTAPGGLDLASGGDVMLGAIDSPMIRTRDQELSIINPNGITVAGQIDLGGVTTGTDLSLVGSTGVKVVGPVNLAIGKNFTASSNGEVRVGLVNAADVTLVGGFVGFSGIEATGRLQLSSGGSIEGGSAEAAEIVADAQTNFKARGLVANAGAIKVTAVDSIDSGSIDAAELDLATTTGSIGLSFDTTIAGDATISAGKFLTFGKLSAAGAIKLSASGFIRGDSATGTTLSFESAGGISTGALRATKGEAVLTSANSITVSDLSARSAVLDAGSGGIRFLSILATGGATLTTDGEVRGSSLTGPVTITAGEHVFLDSLTTFRDSSIAANQIIAIGLLEGAFDPAAISIVSQTGPLSIDEVNFVGTIDARASDISMKSTGDLRLGALSATNDLQLGSDGALSFATLTAGNAIQADAQGDVLGGSATAGSIAITTPGTLVADDLVATTGALSVIADKGVTLDTAVSAGTTTLKAAQGLVKVASNLQAGEGLVLTALSLDLTAQNGLKIVQAATTGGDLKLTSLAGNLTAGTLSSTGGIALTALGGRIDVTNDITASGPIQATAQALSLTALNDLIVDKALATGGDVLLASRNGGVTIGQASATGGLTATTPGLLSLTGVASGATIAFTSRDIAIGSAAQLGSKTQTTALTLTSTAERMFIGDAAGAGYRIDAAELTRLASKGDISLVSAPQEQVDLAFTLIDPAASNIVAGALTFDGAQLGSNGTLRIASPRSIGFSGNAQFKNFGSGQTVTVAAATDISLAAEAGLVTLKDSAGALAGTLRLEAQQVHAMSSATRSDVAGLTLNDARQRLGTNDQVNNQGGYFQAGNIVVRIGRLLFIQNSGANGTDPDVFRGLTANSLTISAGEGATPQIVLNGRVNGATGAGLRETVVLNGSFDPGSGFNSCLIGASCGFVAPPPPPDPVIDPTPAVSSARDQIEDDEDEDEKEEALQAAQTRPDPIIQFMTPPSSRFDPLIDEPVTGAGNEDFWELPLVPSPGQ